MHWILQTNLFNENEWNTLVSTLERFSIPHSVHKVIPFIGELVPPAEPTQDKVICFGSYSMRHTAKANNWNPGVYDLFDINFNEQMKHWGNEMLNSDSIVCAFKDAVITEEVFIRPIDDSKYFAGKVFSPEEWNPWREGIVKEGYDYGNSLTPDTLVQISVPKIIYAEYRYWIVNGEIVTRSLYKRGQRVVYSADVDRRFDEYVTKVLRNDITLTVHNHPEWLPKAFVIDVADTPNGYRIVEPNTINSAGFYAGNIVDIVLALERLNT